MQLDGGKRQVRRTDNYRQLRFREATERSRNAQRFERMMTSRLNSIDISLRTIQSRIDSEVQRRVTEELDALLTGPVVRDIINERVARAVAQEEYESESDFELSSDSEDSESEIESESEPEQIESESEEEEEEEEEYKADEPSTSIKSKPVYPEDPEEYVPNKWEFVSTFGAHSDFTLDKFTNPVRASLNLPQEAPLFPRLTLEEIIEREHPTDELKFTSANRPDGKDLMDEEFFCLAPCCSSSRLFQAASCPFLPSFVKKRMVEQDGGRVIVQRSEHGVELITPFKPTLPGIPGVTQNVPEQKEEDVVEEEEEEEEDPLENPDVVEELMHEHFFPTPHEPYDEFIFGPYLRRLREPNDVPTDLLRALVRRVNSNLENSYQGHRELELFAELDEVLVDEKHGRLPLDRMNN